MNWTSSKTVGVLITGLILVSSSLHAQWFEKPKPKLYASQTLEIMNEPLSKHPRVTIVYNYACIHCAHLNVLLPQFEASLPTSVTVEHLPLPAGGVWTLCAQVQYAMHQSNSREKYVLDQAMFDMLHKDKVQPTPKSIEQYLKDHHISNAQGLATRLQSPQVQQDVQKALTQVIRWQIQSTPTIVVNGRYKIHAAQSGQVEMLKRVKRVLAATSSP